MLTQKHLKKIAKKKNISKFKTSKKRLRRRLKKMKKKSK